MEKLLMTKKEFKEAMQVLNKVAKDDTRPIMQGVCFNGNEVVAIDGYRLAIRRFKEELNGEYVVLGKDLKGVVKACKRDIEQVEIIFNDKAIINLYDVEKKIVNTFEFRLLEVRFIAYRSLLLNDFESTVELEAKKILDIIKPLKKNSQMALKLTGEEIKINQITYTRESKDKKILLNEIGIIDLKKKVSKDLLIAFNVTYLSEALKGYEGVKINYKDNVSPFVIESENKYDMILPIRINHFDIA